MRVSTLPSGMACAERATQRPAGHAVQPYQMARRRVRTAYHFQTAHSNCSRRTGPQPPSALNVSGTAVSNRNPPSCDFFQKPEVFPKNHNPVRTAGGPCARLPVRRRQRQTTLSCRWHQQRRGRREAAAWLPLQRLSQNAAPLKTFESHRRAVVEVRQSARHLSARLSLTLGSTPDLLKLFLCDFSWLEFRIGSNYRNRRKRFDRQSRQSARSDGASIAILPCRKISTFWFPSEHHQVRRKAT
jgi:hypothetical protein